MRAGVSIKLSQPRLIAGAFAVLAYLSIHKFPGLSGALGAAGWLIVAATIYRHPSVLNLSDRPWQASLGLALVLGAGLLLIVGSVVAWSLEC